MNLSILWFVLFATITASNSSFHYDGYKVYQVIPKTLAEAKLISEFEYDSNFDFWSEMRALHMPVDVMVTPFAQSRFETFLKSENIEHSILIDDVEDKVQAENDRQRKSKRLTRGEVSFTRFMRYDDIESYMEQLDVLYPTIARTEIIGKTFEGRNLTLIKISTGGLNKPTIYLEAGIHAREWIAPPVAAYIMHQLVENPENAGMIQDVDWVILPVVNPDGYEFTHENTRLWRKTRTPGTICDGTDGNRNFDSNWMVTGASSWQCSETYAGHSPFSEPETRAIRDYILANKENIKLFVDIHSYGNWLLYPWGYTTVPAENADELQHVGDLVNDAIYAVRGTNYSVGNSNILLYATSGSAPDYAKGAAGISLAYTLELPRGGSAGFNPPDTDILPVVEETWEGFKAFYDYIREKYVS